MVEHTLTPVSSRESSHLLGGLILTRERLLGLLDELDERDIHQSVRGLPSIAGYALHLAQVEYWWNKTVLREEELTVEEREHYLFDEKQAIFAPTELEKSWFLSRLGEARMLTREHYMSISDIEFRSANLTVKGKAKEDTYSPEWILHHLNFHESYHLGQMYLVLKWMNGCLEEWDHFSAP
ncbi:DinB family protein [Salipaludibacillus sp. HK11]|uniref:DinB family protein n=1 Tax=Salipaludibacillus sp. HK11 TaxID=3394320 RepID=UPI0039FCC94E